MKKETLEEAADKYFPSAEKIGEETYTAYKGFIEGAKWQAKKMYSEEEVLHICEEVRWRAIGDPIEFTKNFKDWFEQIKKK